MQHINRNLKFFLLSFIALSFILSCKKDTPKSNLAGLTSFSIKDLPVDFTIDEGMGTISNADSLPFETDVSQLVAQFTAVPKTTVNVGGTMQESGVTVNNFSNPVNYTVVAENGSTTKNYTVTVNVSQVDPKTIAWQQLTMDPGWGNFHSVTFANLDNKFYMIGGTKGSFGAFDFTTNVSEDGITWTRTRAVDDNGDSVSRVEHPAFITFKDKLWILGGHRPGVGFAFDDVTNKVWSSSDGVAWDADVPANDADRWSKRERIEAVVFNGMLWVVGGNPYPSFGNTNAPSAAYNDIWNTTDGINWTQVTPAATFIPRTHPSVFVYDEKIWVVGGIDNGDNYLSDVWNSTDGVTWTEVTVNTPFPGRTAAEVVINKDQIIMVGGENADGVLGDMWVSENGGVDWTKIESGDVRALPSNFKPRKDFSMLVHDGSIYIFGGLGTKDAGSGKYTYVQDIWKGQLQ